MSYRYLKEHEYHAAESKSGDVNVTGDPVTTVTIVDAAGVGDTQRVKLFGITLQALDDQVTTVTIEDTDQKQIREFVLNESLRNVSFDIPLELVTPGAGLQLALSAANQIHWSASYHVA